MARKQPLHAPERPVVLPAGTPSGSSVATLGILLVAVAVLYFGRDIFIPFALATLLSFVLAPLVMRLRRLHLGRVPAVLSVVMVAFLVMAGLGSVVASQITNLADNIPVYERNLKAKIHSLQHASSGGGVLDRASSMLRDLKQELSGATQAPPPDSPGREAAATRPQVQPVPVQIHTPESSPLDVLTSVASPVIGPIGTAGLVLVFVIFMLLQREDLRDRLIRLVGAGDIHRTTQALNDAAQRVSRYLLMQLIVNVLYGIPIGIGLYFIGVPNPVLWGLLATFLRFIPYAGPFIAAAFPIGLSFAVAPGWTMPLMTIGLFLSLELLSNNVLEPWLYGSSTGISSVAILLAAIFWTSLWGWVGLLLSTPLTVCLVVLGRHVPQLQFLSVLVGNEPVLPLEARFYQRMLAGDAVEATEFAEEFLKDQPLVTLYDSVVLPALSLAEHDRQRGVLDEERQQAVADGTISVIDYFADYEDLAVEQGIETPVQATEPTDATTAAMPDTTVCCIAARTALDRAAASMLAQLLARRGIPAQVMTADALTTANLARLQAEHVGLLCMSFLHPSALLHARHLCKRLRRHVGGGVKIMAGFWNTLSEEARRQDAVSATTADLVATSFQEALDRVQEVVDEQLPAAMVPAPPAEHEEERLAELQQLDLLDTEPEEAFDRVTRQLAAIFGTPISLMSLIDQTRQFWKSATGLPDDLATARQSARETSVCGHVVASNEVLVIEDVKKDRRFANNPFLKERGIRFYAGAPLTTRNGHAIGSVCVIDNKPRKISAREVALLRLVADGVMKEVELRKMSREAAIIVERLEKWDHLRRRDLELARAVQHFLLPPEQYRGSTYLLCHSYQPRPDGGRTLTHVEVSSDGTAALLLADVCGEGAAAALMAVLLKSVFSCCVQTQMDAATALTTLNAELGTVAHAGDRVTAIVCMFDPLRRKLRMASAGHPAPILLRDDAVQALALRGGPPLMVVPDQRYEQVAVDLKVADRLLLYTDGAVDVANNDESFLGLEGLSELVRECRHYHGKDFLQRLFLAIQGFAGHDLEDDVALLALECVEDQTLPPVASDAPANTTKLAASDGVGA